MTPNQLAKLIAKTAVGDIRENERSVILAARLLDQTHSNEWFETLSQDIAYVDEINLASPVTDEIFDAARLPDIGDSFQLVLNKKTHDSELRLFFTASLLQNRLTIPDFQVVKIADIDDNDSFETYKCSFLCWHDDTQSIVCDLPDLPDPRQFSIDFSERNEVPSDIRPWLVRLRPKTEDGVFEVWQALASRPLMAAISDRVSRVGGDIYYHFNGPPTSSFKLADEELEVLTDRLASSAEWIFVNEPRDADARHLLLASEWARSFRKSALSELGENSLASAQAAYKAYIKSRSAETLVALSGLRRSVLEETQTISQRAHDFAKSMWKDLAVAAAPFVIKVFADAASASSVTNAIIAKNIAFAAAAFLALSLVAQWYLNERWISHQRKARGVWKLEIETALTNEEIDDIAENPIKRSLFDFRLVGAVVTCFYIFLIFILIQYGRGLIEV